MPYDREAEAVLRVLSGEPVITYVVARDLRQADYHGRFYGWHFHSREFVLILTDSDPIQALRQLRGRRIKPGDRVVYCGQASRGHWYNTVIEELGRAGWNRKWTDVVV